jgi:hypothetical protein
VRGWGISSRRCVRAWVGWVKEGIVHLDLLEGNVHIKQGDADDGTHGKEWAGKEHDEPTQAKAHRGGDGVVESEARPPAEVMIRRVSTGAGQLQRIQ